METITISKQEYKQLLMDNLILTALENGGVVDWSWYPYAINDFLDECKIIYEIENEDEEVDLFDLISEKIIEERFSK